MNFRKVPSQIGHVTRSPRYSQDTGGRSGRSYRTFSRERYFRRALVAALVTKPLGALAALNMPLGGAATLTTNSFYFAKRNDRHEGGR
jgi:hypothetical protein